MEVGKHYTLIHIKAEAFLNYRFRSTDKELTIPILRF